MSLYQKRLKSKIWIAYTLLSVIPLLFMVYLASNDSLSSLLPRLNQSFAGRITLLLGGGGLIVMSLAGLMLLYRSVSSIAQLAEQTEQSYSRVVRDDIKLVTGNEVEKLSHYFTGVFQELQHKMEEADKYARELAEANKKLVRLAMKDGLTDLYNQAYIKERIEQEISRASQFNHQLSVIMMDIDDFKNYNDTCGHLSGDEGLQQIARLIMNHIRPVDVPARYGGEEFLIILPETNSRESHQMAENIRKAIQSYPFRGCNAKEPFHLTVSLGVCHYSPEVKGGAAELIRSADTALYEAKRKGKNCVIVQK